MVHEGVKPLDIGVILAPGFIRFNNAAQHEDRQSHGPEAEVHQQLS